MIIGKISSRSVYATLINRAYYSAYSYAILWLEMNTSFKFKTNADYKKMRRKPMSKHKQVRDELKIKNNSLSGNLLSKLFRLRKIADYDINEDLTKNDADEAINLMEEIIKSLKFS